MKCYTLPRTWTDFFFCNGQSNGKLTWQLAHVIWVSSLCNQLGWSLIDSGTSPKFLGRTRREGRGRKILPSERPDDLRDALRRFNYNHCQPKTCLEGASSLDNDVVCYVIIRRSMDCIFDTQRAPKSPYRRSRWKHGEISFCKVAYSKYYLLFQRWFRRKTPMKLKVPHHRASINYIWCGGNPTTYFYKTKSLILNRHTWSAGNDFMTVPTLRLVYRKCLLESGSWNYLSSWVWRRI